MKNFWVKRQKGIGITLIILGIMLLISVTGYLYSKNSWIKGFSQFLPENDTVLYFEFPANLDNNGTLTQKINQFLNLDWNKDILPLIGEKGAFAFLKNSDTKRIFPAIFFQIKSDNETIKFLADYKNLQPELETVLLDDNALLLISSSYKPSSGARLNENKDFIKLRQNLNSTWFAYANTKKFMPEIDNLISQMIPVMPLTLSPFKAIGISAENSDGIWQGRSYAINQENILINNEQAYRALLLPILPSDFDIIISGQNLPAQITKINLLGGVSAISDFLSVFGQQYLESQNFENLFSKEFAVVINGEKILIASELTDQNTPNQISLLLDAFSKNAAKFAPKIRDIELPDGTKAKEMMPDSSQVKILQEDFYGLPINGITIADDKNVYTAAIQNKLLVSNDLSSIKKIMMFIKEPGGFRFRESELYKTFLRPILKNPELAGVASTKEGIFSFSKRTFSDHMETNFMLK